MKKSRIRFIALMVAVILALPNFTYAGAYNNEDDQYWTEEEALEHAKLEQPALIAYDELYAAWSVDGEITYPDTFGGYYIDDHFNLTVKIVGDDEALKQQVLDIVSDDDVIKFESTDISFVELKSLNSEVAPMLFDKGFKVLSSGIDVETSEVAVDISKSSLAKANLEGNNVSLDPHVSINFVDDTNVVKRNDAKENVLQDTDSATSMNLVSATCGEKLYDITDLNSGGSTGFYGKYNFGNGLEPCIVTAGHVIYYAQQKNQTLAIDGQIVLQSYNNEKSSFVHCVYGNERSTTQIPHISDGDYAFFKYSTADVLGTNRLDGQSTTLDYYTLMYKDLDGYTVYKVGAKTGLTHSTVSHIDVTYYVYTYNYPGTSYYNQDIAIMNVLGIEDDTAFGKPGDSGAPVYIYKTFNTQLTAVLCGIFDGAEVSPLYIVTPMQTICSDGKLTPSMPRFPMEQDVN